MSTELPTLRVLLPRRRWRTFLSGCEISRSGIRLLSRVRQGKPASYLDLSIRDFVRLQQIEVLPKVEISLKEREP